MKTYNNFDLIDTSVKEFGCTTELDFLIQTDYEITWAVSDVKGDIETYILTNDILAKFISDKFGYIVGVNKILYYYADQRSIDSWLCKVQNLMNILIQEG